MLADIDRIFSDRDRKRQEIAYAPWQLGLASMTAGAATFGAGAAFVKLLGRSTMIRLIEQLTDAGQRELDVTTEPRNCTVSRRSKSSLRTPSFDTPAGFAIAAHSIQYKVLIPISESACRAPLLNASSGESGFKQWAAHFDANGQLVHHKLLEPPSCGNAAVSPLDLSSATDR